MLITLVPQNEKLFVDVTIKNEDVSFVHAGQTAQIKLAADPFKKYGMQIVAKINQGKHSVLEYFLSPVQKVLQEAGHER